MTLKPVLLSAAATLVFAGAAEAKGWYASLEAGAVTIQDVDALFRFSTGLVYSPEGQFDTGWALIGAVGYDMQGWRIEGEVGWRSNDKDRFSAPLASTGDLDELTVMYNMTYDFTLGNDVRISVGGGAGLDYAHLDIAGIDDGDLNFAYQGIAQLNYPISANTDVVLGYRYLHVLDPEFEDIDNVKFDDFDKHTFTLGFRFTFAP